MLTWQILVRFELRRPVQQFSVLTAGLFRHTEIPTQNTGMRQGQNTQAGSLAESFAVTAKEDGIART